VIFFNHQEIQDLITELPRGKICWLFQKLGQNKAYLKASKPSKRALKGEYFCHRKFMAE
jgi:hypothetical protein